MSKPATIMNRLRLAAALTVVAVPGMAQIQPGKVYTGGEQIGDPRLGFQLTVPAGWRGELSPDGAAFVLQSDVDGGYMVVAADQTTEAEARQAMSAAVDLGDGIVLTPTSNVQQVAPGHFSASYSVQGTPSELVATADTRLTAGGVRVTFIVISPPAAAATQQAAMREFALSLGVTEPVSQSAAGDDEWEPWLRGRYLARYFTRTGYTESSELWLCSDGTFYYDSQGGGFGGGASGASQTTGSGQWSATGAGRNGMLLLQWGTAETSSWPLEYDYENDQVFVNGQRMLRGNNERCQ